MSEAQGNHMTETQLRIRFLARSFWRLDGVCKCEQLLNADLATLIPLPLLGGTARLQLSKELLVLKRCLCSVIEILLHGGGLNSVIADASQLVLHRLLPPEFRPALMPPRHRNLQKFPPIWWHLQDLSPESPTFA